jgi:hypothetical protein
MGWIILALYLLGAVSLVASFYAGGKGNRKLKDLIVNFWAKIADDPPLDWSGLFRLSAKGYLSYLAYLLGSRIFSLKFVVRVLVYSVVWTTIVLAAAILYTIGYNLSYFRNYLFRTSAGADIFW